MAERLTDLPPCTRLILRGRPPAIAAATAALGFPLPQQPCRAAAGAGRSALWLGPDEWLILAPLADPLAVALERAMQPHPHALVDVSHRQLGLGISGDTAADTLNAFCPLDLHPDAFPVGMCTRTVFAKAEIILWRTASDTFRLEVARSFAPYVRALLRDAAAA